MLEGVCAQLGVEEQTGRVQAEARGVRVTFQGEAADGDALRREWRSLQAVPRAIAEDELFPNRLTFYPVETLLALRQPLRVVAAALARLRPSMSAKLPNREPIDRMGQGRPVGSPGGSA